MNNRSDPFSLRYGAAAVLGLLIAAAGVLQERWLAGALLNPLEPALLLAAGALVACAAALVRIGWSHPPTSAIRSPRSRWTVMVLTSLAAVALTVSLWVPGTPVVWIAVVGTILAVEEVWAWWPQKRGQNYYLPTKSPSGSPMQEKIVLTPLLPPLLPQNYLLPAKSLPAPHIHEINSSDPFFPSFFPSAEVVQQLTRSRAMDGTEELSGWLRMAFAAGQRTGSVHVAFCPPLSVVPELSVEQIEGPEARVKTAQLLPYGVRLDLKLVAPAEEPASVLLQFSARAAK
jgi:hypothetical protein